MESFRFKKFTVSHQYSFKIGTDAVLLGALCPVQGGERILDIGTGSGIVALMLLQRGVNFAVGIEIDRLAASEAQENANRSPWSKQMATLCGDFCDTQFISRLGLFNLIVSNPPFFSNSLKPLEKIRRQTRHSDQTLPFNTLIENVISVLLDNGSFCVILPVSEANTFIQKAQQQQLFLSEIHHIFPKPEKQESRQVLVFKKNLQLLTTIETSLYIRNNDDSYSTNYKMLTKQFHLNFE